MHAEPATDSNPATAAPRIAATLDELIAGATNRTEVRSSDAKSGAHFERLTIDGQPLFLKVLSADQDWIMRITGNTTNWEFKVWKAGLYQRAPQSVDHAMVGMSLEGTGPSAVLAQLMTDRTDDMVPPGDTPLPIDHHLGFIDHMAEFHAAFMGWHDDIGLQDQVRRVLFFAPDNIAAELQVDDVPGPIAVAHQGWGMLPDRSPRLHALVSELHRHPHHVVDALRETPLTFVAGDWKLGNVGRRADGRTVLIDWAYPGEAAPCWELAWYLALNSARIPQSKEATIAHYRASLERHGVDTTGWFERQLGLSLAGMAAVFAWEKAVGDGAELEWWESAALDGAKWLG